MEIPISFEKLRRITKLTDFQIKVEVGKEILKYLPELGEITFQEMINYIKTNKKRGVYLDMDLEGGYHKPTKNEYANLSTIIIDNFTIICKH